jgi:hypothetical protein
MKDIIIIELKKYFDKFIIQQTNNLVWVRNGNTLVYTLDLNLLEYYHINNQLKEYLKTLEK